MRTTLRNIASRLSLLNSTLHSPPIAMPIIPFCELSEGQEADFFVVLSQKELRETKAGKPYFTVGFRDANRTASFPVWNDSPLYPMVEQWETGEYFKIRGVYQVTKYGPQIDLIQVRKVTDADRAYGFNEQMFVAHSRFDSETMYGQIYQILRDVVGTSDPLYELCDYILNKNKAELLTLSAASHNHHACVGGWLEHTLNVLKNAVYLGQRYTQQYPDLDPPLDLGLMAVGAVLHDIGKLQEIAFSGAGFEYTVEGSLIGHMLLGRDIVRDACNKLGLRGQRFALLEHVIIAHQRLPEWGSPKPPMIPEALLVHYADDIDAKFAILTKIQDALEPGKFSSSQNSIGCKIYRPEEEK